MVLKAKWFIYPNPHWIAELKLKILRRLSFVARNIGSMSAVIFYFSNTAHNLKVARYSFSVNFSKSLFMATYSNLGGVDPEKLYRATLTAQPY